MKKSLTLLLVMQLLGYILIAQTNIKAMSYNLEDFPEAPPTNRELYLKTIVKSEQPDLLMVCELQSQTGANEILNVSLQTTDNHYKSAVFVSNQSQPYDTLQQLVFYNKQKLILKSQNVITTTIRDINHYLFILNTTAKNTNPIYLDVFVTHLKASSGTTNEQKRLTATQDFTSYLSSVPTSHYVLFGGDFNFYSSSEPGLQEILKTTNPIIMIDPINMLGSWHNNSTYKTIHTQATRAYQLSGYGAYGGLDDRFDFIFMSKNLQNGTNLYYVTNSYKAVGNNGDCFNLSINGTSCTGTYSQSLRDTLYTMSDHLPVVLELQTPENTLSIKKNNFSPLIELENGNIVSNQLYIKTNANYTNQHIYIYNQLGQKVKTFYVQKENQTPLDISNLSLGFYYIKLSDASLSVPIKFIKSN